MSASVEDKMALLPRHLQGLLVSSSVFQPWQCVPELDLLVPVTSQNDWRDR